MNRPSFPYLPKYGITLTGTVEQPLNAHALVTGQNNPTPQENVRLAQRRSTNCPGPPSQTWLHPAAKHPHQPRTRRITPSSHTSPGQQP